MDTGRVNELVECIFVEPLHEMVQKYFIQMRCLLVPLLEGARSDIIQLIVILAGTV